LARGVDENEVISDRLTQSISAEDTLEVDVEIDALEPMIRRMAEKTWIASRKETRIARTVVLKLKTSTFRIMTRSHTPERPPASCEELTAIALMLRERVPAEEGQLFRLVGVGLSNFRELEEPGLQSELFEDDVLLD
jgi:DNA polymerase-4